MATRNLEPDEYEQYLCEHLIPVLRRLNALSKIQVTEAVLDMKSAIADFTLDAELPEAEVAHWRGVFAANPMIAVDSQGVTCREHYCSLGARPSPGRSSEPPSFWRRTWRA